MTDEKFDELLKDERVIKIEDYWGLISLKGNGIAIEKGECVFITPNQRYLVYFKYRYNSGEHKTELKITRNGEKISHFPVIQLKTTEQIMLVGTDALDHSFTYQMIVDENIGKVTLKVLEKPEIVTEKIILLFESRI